MFQTSVHSLGRGTANTGMTSAVLYVANRRCRRELNAAELREEMGILLERAVEEKGSIMQPASRSYFK